MIQLHLRLYYSIKWVRDELFYQQNEEIKKEMKSEVDIHGFNFEL